MNSASHGSLSALSESWRPRRTRAAPVEAFTEHDGSLCAVCLSRFAPRKYVFSASHSQKIGVSRVSNSRRTVV